MKVTFSAILNIIFATSSPSSSNYYSFEGARICFSFCVSGLKFIVIDR